MRNQTLHNAMKLTCVLIPILALFLSTSASPADIVRGHSIRGQILEEYYAASTANKLPPELYFGIALSPELNSARGGRWQEFQNGQSIYWHALVSGGAANQVGGAILQQWGNTQGPEGGYEWGPLRYPTTREWPGGLSAVSQMRGRGNHFEGGSIYWTQATGAWTVWGLIREAWWQSGAEAGPYGYPIGPETPVSGGWKQMFEGGEIHRR